jgi:hypothetical protein
MAILRRDRRPGPRSRQRPLWSACLVVGLALGLALPGCGKDKTKITKVAVPDSGVQLRYDLTGGQSYGGHVRMRNNVQTPMGDLIQAIEFDVDLVVGSEAGEASTVLARCSKIEFDLRLPQGLPDAMAMQIPPEAVKAAEGMEVQFKLDTRGQLTEMPEPPGDAEPAMQAVIGMVAGALQSAFVELPEEHLKEGATWNAASGEDTGRTGTGKFEGMGVDKASGENVARLSYAYERAGAPQGEGEGPRVQGTQKVEALFSTNGYAMKIERTINAEISGLGGMVSEVEVAWKKLDKRAVAPAAQPGGEEQAVTDPCDPDYVGAEECPAAAPAQ